MKHKLESEPLLPSLILRLSRRIDELHEEVELLRIELNVFRSEVEELRKDLKSLSELTSKLLLERRKRGLLRFLSSKN